MDLADYTEKLSVPSFSEEAKSLVPGTYEHYKHKRYEVIGLAHHTETMEEMVVYLDENLVLWIRPVKMFCEEVILPNGSIVPRFRRKQT